MITNLFDFNDNQNCADDNYAQRYKESKSQNEFGIG